MRRNRIYDLTVNGAIGFAVILVAIVVYLAVAVIAGIPEAPSAPNRAAKPQQSPMSK